MKRILLVVIVLITFFGCHNPPLELPIPTKATLVAPANNSTCITDSVLSATQSLVHFTWKGLPIGETYDLNIKNLLNGTVTTQTTTAHHLNVALTRNTPYSWYVVSKVGLLNKTAASDVWKFYNAGEAATYYAPFPADLTAPGYGENVVTTEGKVSLTWSGADVNNDILGYDVYVGTGSANMAIVASNITANKFDATVTNGITYYWKIVSKDSHGNDSSSDVYQFVVL